MNGDFVVSFEYRFIGGSGSWNGKLPVDLETRSARKNGSTVFFAEAHLHIPTGSAQRGL